MQDKKIPDSSHPLGMTVYDLPLPAEVAQADAKRTSMVDGLGLIIEDEDDDASTLEIDPELKATLDKLEGAETVDKLLEFNKIALAKYENNANAKTFILGTYVQARKRLTGGPQ